MITISKITLSNIFAFCFHSSSFIISVEWEQIYRSICDYGSGNAKQKTYLWPWNCKCITWFCNLLSLRGEQILIQVHVDIIYLHDELLQQKQLFSLHWFKIMAWSKWIYSNSEHPESWQDHHQQTWLEGKFNSNCIQNIWSVDKTVTLLNTKCN